MRGTSAELNQKIMATFFYKAVGKTGSMVDGTVEGADDKAVALKLQEMGLIPIQIGTRKSNQPWNLDCSSDPPLVGP